MDDRLKAHPLRGLKGRWWNIPRSIRFSLL